MVAYSIDLRERVLAAVDRGEETQEQIAKRFLVSSRWIRKLVAVYEGGTDVSVMQAFAEGELRRIMGPGDIMVMDNLSAHKDAGVIAAIESAGAIACYLLPYSPDFNPIEAMWSKVKEILRSLKARTAEALLDAIGVALRAVTATDAEGWFAHSGYGNTEW